MPENPMSRGEIDGKFMSLASAAAGAEPAARILEAARGVFGAGSAKPLADLLARVRVAGPAVTA
jgi:hypothetical protein